MYLHLPAGRFQRRMWSFLALKVVILQMVITGASCFVNVAHTPSQSLQGTATMNEAPFPNKQWIADNVVDGSTDQKADGGSCAIMDFSQNYKFVWLKVQLGKLFNVAYIKIFFRDEKTLYRMSGFSIYAYYDANFNPSSPDSNNLVYHHDPMSGCPAPIQNITVNRLVKQIVFTNNRSTGFQTNCPGQSANSFTSIEICEIKVMGCDSIRYYYGCSKECTNICTNRHCDAFNGSCAEGCTNPNALTADCLECPNKQYISNRQCINCKGHCRDGSACNKLTGHCDGGCETQWTGEFCELCIDHFYGQNCDKHCGHCKNNDPCDKLTGHCPRGCQNHWSGEMCDACSAKFYNANCTGICGNCLNGQSCDKENGHCLNGCKPHFQSPLCQKCEDGFYNPTCTETCGNCINGADCNKEDGYCPNGCTNHYKYPFCKECEDHFYGHLCNFTCGHCKNGDICDKNNGTCHQGCMSNYKKPNCEVCENGFYNINCTGECGHCLNGEQCNRYNGTCFSGCISNFQEPMCKECRDGFYNSNCTEECGKCRNEEVCNKLNGYCDSGCQLNFDPPLCKECKNGFYNNACTEKCGHCNGSVACDKNNGTCPVGCEPNFKPPLCQDCVDGFYGDNCESKCGKCMDGKTCNIYNGSCENGCISQFQPPLCLELLKKDQENSNTGAIAGGIVSSLIVLLAIGIAGIIYKRRSGSKNSDSNSKGQSKPHTFHSKYSSKEKKYADLKDDLPEPSPREYMNDTITVEDWGYYNTAEFNTVIRVEDLQQVVSEKSAGENNTFHSEYKRLPIGNTSICKEGKKQENMAKNRFKTTFPYDNSRVILKEMWNDDDNDYINANYIKGHNGQRMYIAAQGPKNNTLADFWRMIWQENVRLIVMLTNIVENGKNKCTQYWPAKERPMEVGQCKMQLLKENMYAFHTYRKFSVQNQTSSGKRTITQFHYTAWPDHGTPEEIGLVQFHRAVNKSNQHNGLMLVHCSAGVGRTGTFIGLDSLLKQGRETGRINVFEFVKQMREDRMTMVQTPDQYIFLHKALLFGFQDKVTVVPECDILTKFDALLQDSSPLNQRALYKEYKFLQTAKPVFEDEDKDDGRKPENKDKNSNMNVIPVSKYRPYLTSYVKGRNDYINAVFVPSFSNLGAFIVTQTPLPETKVDLWTLCMDHDVKAIAILTEHNEEIQWIPKKSCSFICAPYTLTSGDTGSSISGVTQDTLLIQNDATKQNVDVFHIPFENESAMLKGAELLLEKGKESEFTTVVISKDGAGPSGIFCVLHNALQQLRLDREVDILNIVRLIHTRRPEVITKLEEYRRCYKLVSLSIAEDGMYANM